MNERINEMLQQLTSKGITDKEAIELIGIRIKNNYERVTQGAVSIKELLNDNVFGKDFTLQFNNLINAGLSEDEAIGIYRNRFYLWLNQLKLAHIEKQLEIG